MSLFATRRAGHAKGNGVLLLAAECCRYTVRTRCATSGIAASEHFSVVVQVAPQRTIGAALLQYLSLALAGDMAAAG